MEKIQHRKHYEAPRLIKRNKLAIITAEDSGLISLIPTVSDMRLKQDIRQIGFTAHGLPYYSFRYFDQPGVYEGVMAQEVLGVMPDAVVIDADGYLRVNYKMLGVPFRRVH
jgi:hypothetical protein